MTQAIKTLVGLIRLVLLKKVEVRLEISPK